MISCTVEYDVSRAIYSKIATIFRKNNSAKSRLAVDLKVIKSSRLRKFKTMQNVSARHSILLIIIDGETCLDELQYNESTT